MALKRQNRFVIAAAGSKSPTIAAGEIVQPIGEFHRPVWLPNKARKIVE
jgi:hypothetical protein